MTIQEHHNITALGLRDYDDMLLTIKIKNEWIDVPMYKNKKDQCYIVLNGIIIYVDDLCNI